MQKRATAFTIEIFLMSILRTQVSLHRDELKLLRFIIMMRYAMIVIINKYVLSIDASTSTAFRAAQDAQTAWTQLKIMCSTTEGEIAKAWRY